MKKYLLSTLADGICVVLLSVCPILCYASAFSVKLEASVLIMAAVLFSIVFSLLSAFVKNNLKYALCMTVIAFVAFLVFVFANERIFAQANYAINKLLELYSVYLSVYSNLSRVYVKAGDRVSTRQALGQIYSDSEDNNSTVLHFQIWKERTKLNPSAWLE